jgi:hypothetical protein
MMSVYFLGFYIENLPTGNSALFRNLPNLRHKTNKQQQKSLGYQGSDSTEQKFILD